ncbi:ovochymase-2-like [Diachasma alloeum]|uniref:ovochymase-2-like n=1 Tax=Diachasma alloeum TaxID=454923 RepID=UPI0010FB7CB9|nr:ovochymase-2-like [Diachasma alloeum]
MISLMIIQFFVVRVVIGQYDVSYGSPAYKHCVCGKKNPPLVGDIRIVGGYTVKESEYPWMAMITGNGSLLSGGSLINDRYVVTAAHLHSFGFRINELKVVVGEHDRCRSHNRTVIFSVERMIKHLEYNADNNYADIMLMRLNMRVTFNEFVRPICLPPFEPFVRTRKLYRGKSVTAVGWGLADTGEEVCLPREVKLEIFRDEDCDVKVETLICAGTYGNGKDSCAGDSGGPLQIVNKRDKYELLGIVSSGVGCGTGTPGYYTDVPRMVPWIMKMTTRDSMYCWR